MVANVPTSTPTLMVSAKEKITPPPRISRAREDIMVVPEVSTVRAKVWLMLMLIRVPIGLSVCRCRFSRRRSKVMIVSFSA